MLGGFSLNFNQLSSSFHREERVEKTLMQNLMLNSPSFNRELNSPILMQF